MRQAILVVGLISASFLGGVFVNGPALNWAQTRVIRSLGLHESAEIASVNLRPTPDAQINSDASQSGMAKDSLQEPIAPAPTVFGSKETSADRATAHQAGTHSNSRGEKTSQSAVMTPQTTQPPKLLSTLDPALSIAMLESAKLSTADATSGLPEVAAAPDKTGSVRNQALSGSRTRQDSWAGLQETMKSLGVTRFQIEGEPGNRVLFSCLIPLAGRQAVSQRFEADGEDVISAAQSALRRVALWRAAQAQAP